jgi:site-specific recombinase XerD
LFAPLATVPSAVSWRDIAACIQPQRQSQLAAATMTRRLNALKHFFASRVLQDQPCARNPGKPRHCLRRGRPLPQPLAPDQVRALFAQITPPLEHALGWLRRRGGLRVSAVARLRLEAMDWTPPS